MQSKRIKDHADDQGTSRSVRLTAQAMVARLEGVIKTKISTLKRDLESRSSNTERKKSCTHG